MGARTIWCDPGNWTSSADMGTVVLALAGGVGGARLAAGLAQCLVPEELTVAVNVGDDFTHCGLRISPDLDTVMYTLAGRHNEAQGWGLAGESWRSFGALQRLGGPAWFQLGDEDIATHLVRTQLLDEGLSLSAVTQRLASALGVRPRVVPMSDRAVRTLVRTDQGELAFQRYFVERRCEPVLQGLRFAGAEQATASEGLSDGLASPSLKALVICPSNPYLSIQPFLSLPGLRARLQGLRIPRIAVSPLIGGAAVKGPAAKIMCELGHEVSSLGVARFYRGLIDGLLIHHSDAEQAAAIEALGIAVHVTDTLMGSPERQKALASEVLGFSDRLAADALV
jgi:LPPG:FO 2-phospho-L-lactate transferase